MLIAYTNHGDCSWVNSGAGDVRVASVSQLTDVIDWSSVFMHFVSTIDKRLFVSLNYASHVVSDDVARSHLQATKDLLDLNCR